MRKLFMLLICLFTITINAGNNSDGVFKGYFVNEKYNVYIRINLYQNNLSIPGQAVFGEVPGYFADRNDSRKWIFTSAKINGNTAYLEIINDYGSEDLEATFTKKNDSIYVLKQTDGSQLKIARNRKWVNIPKTLEFVKK
jgi:hypothetical protein